MERLVSLIRADIAGKIYDGTGVIITRGEEVFLHSALGFFDRESGHKLQNSMSSH
jgi:hypothetical protein